VRVRVVTAGRHGSRIRPRGHPEPHPVRLRESSPGLLEHSVTSADRGALPLRPPRFITALLLPHLDPPLPKSIHIALSLLNALLTCHRSTT
jgi:hypothetical protein